ncbi:MAG: signal peptidase I, partial [Dehalococcoidia bacterium]
MRAATREAIETIALAIFLVLVLQATVANFRVEGPSMDPRLHNHDRVLVNKALYMQVNAARVDRFVPGVDGEEGEIWHPFRSPERGDVIVFQYPRDPGENFVKRVIGLPGETVHVEGSLVFIDGVLLEEPYIEHEAHDPPIERVVPPNHYFVMGDNRAQSDDSRSGWTVPQENIVGKVWVSYWPPG